MGEPFNGFKFPDILLSALHGSSGWTTFSHPQNGEHSHHRAIEGRIQSQGREREKTCITLP